MPKTDEEQFQVIGPRRRGRPRVDEPCATVSTWLPAKHHDRLIQLAKANELSISATVRQLLMLRLPRE
ncbi:MAG: hypothetical protein ABI665_26235 [Vicinamibacterales bacterium]